MTYSRHQVSTFAIAAPSSDHVAIRVMRPYNQYLKRLMDISAVIATLPLSLPLIMCLAFLIWLEGGHPFYSQLRVGRGCKAFRCWKLRTMVVGAERRLQDYLDSNQHARIEWERTQKLKHDPRITTLGRMLRKLSADELPQLWNVLVGDMSLVGPRPILPEQISLYPGTAYYELRPGITGLWQIGDRNRSSFASRALHDTHYANCISLRVDLGILLKTIAVVARGTGW